MAGSNGKDREKAKREELASRKPLLRSPQVKRGSTTGADDPKQRDRNKPNQGGS